MGRPRVVSRIKELYQRPAAPRPGVYDALATLPVDHFIRVAAARIARQYPLVLDLVRNGRPHLSGLLLVAPHLTRDGHHELLSAACGKTMRQVEKLVAEPFPRPDVKASVRQLPAAVAARVAGANEETALAMTPARLAETTRAAKAAAGTGVGAAAQAETDVRAADRSDIGRHDGRSRIEPLAPKRYRVTFTASDAFCDKLERARELPSHAVPPNDLAALLERALDALIAKEEKRRFAVRATPVA